MTQSLASDEIDGAIATLRRLVKILQMVLDATGIVLTAVTPHAAEEY